MTFIRKRSIKELYKYALAEGEGVGTAYEYYAKRLILATWLRSPPTPKRILLAGLPEKYGCSLDFGLLAEECGAELFIMDDRPEAIARARLAWELAWQADLLRQTRPQFLEPAGWNELPTDIGLCLSSEVLQRQSPEDRSIYFSQLLSLSSSLAIFCPNRHNRGHTAISGLSGLSLVELQELLGSAANRKLSSGYIDMPPFPPGITRSEAQRERAGSGKMEGLAMWLLGLFAQTEPFLPNSVRKNRSHIVFGLVTPVQAPTFI